MSTTCFSLHNFLSLPSALSIAFSLFLSLQPPLPLSLPLSQCLSPFSISLSLFLALFFTSLSLSYSVLYPSLFIGPLPLYLALSPSLPIILMVNFSNEVNIFCNLHVCRSCSQMTCERDQRVTRSLKTSESPLTGQHEDEEEEEEGEEPSLSTLSSSSEGQAFTLEGTHRRR